MKKLVLLTLIIGSIAHGAAKTLQVDNKVVTGREAQELSKQGKTVFQCSEVTNKTFVDKNGKKVEGVLQCREVLPYENSSGGMVWKPATTGNRWQ